MDSHRKKKQIIFAVSNVLVPITLIASFIYNWSSIFVLDMMIGYRFLTIIYLGFYIFVFYLRYINSYRQWTALNPFDIIDDIILMCQSAKNWITQKSISTKDFIKLKV